MYNFSVSQKLIQFLILSLTAVDNMYFKAHSQEVHPKISDDYKDELFNEMAKVFKILKEHSLTDNPERINIPLQTIPHSDIMEERQIDSVHQIGSKNDFNFVTESKSLISSPLPIHMDSDYTSPSLHSNSATSLDFHSSDFLNKWFKRKHRFRGSKRHNGAYKKSFRAHIRHLKSVDRKLLKKLPMKHLSTNVSVKENKRKPLVYSDNEKLLPELQNVRENFKNAIWNNSKEPGNMFGEISPFKKEKEFSSGRYTKASKRGSNRANRNIKALNSLFSSSNGINKFSLKGREPKVIQNLIDITSDADNDTYIEVPIKPRPFKNTEISYAGSDFLLDHINKRFSVVDIDSHQIRNIEDEPNEVNTMSNRLFNYFQSHYIIASSILTICFMIIVILGIIAFYIGRNQTNLWKNSKQMSPEGIKKFDLPARPDYSFDTSKAKTNYKNILKSFSKKNKEKRKCDDDSRSLFSIGSCTSLGEINSSDFIRLAKLDNYGRNRVHGGTKNEKDSINKSEAKNKTDDSPAERLMRMHRNFSSRSSTLRSSGSQQSPKSSPVQRRQELEQLSRKRERTCFRNDNSNPPLQTESEAVANSFAIAEDDKAEDLNEIICNAQFSSNRPVGHEERSTCLHRLLINNSSAFNVPSTNNPFEENTETQNTDVSMNIDIRTEIQDKISSLSSSNLQKLCDESTYDYNMPEMSIDPEPETDF
ncbi:uncharacterized protein TNCT_682271 [Trichonephila clavata]|uniref:Uncharacterized protein n=1 Tax=Trichonephila clavata TaxID=2740835 RepID=A0A8X6JGR9_TRICU|nr:uncharacterized protein TNCT_682271 [Trichonephila clavata]